MNHTYASVGSFTPRLVVTDDEGATASVTAPVPVVVTDGLPDHVDFLAYGNFAYDHDADLNGGNLTVTPTSVTGTGTFGGKNGGTATVVVNVTKTVPLFNCWNGTVKVTDPGAFSGTRTSSVYNRQLYPSGGYVAGVATGLDGPGTYTMNWKVWDHPANPPSGSITAGPTQPVPPAGGGLDASYAYDADGLRQSKTVNGITRAFTWDVSGRLPLLLMDGGDVYVYGIANQPVARIDTTSGAAHTLHADQLGSIRVLTDQAGTVVGTYTYDAWGNVTGHTGVSSGLGYAGEYRDEETGFTYLRARHYDPQTGQFLTRDPLVRQTREAYGYTANTPVNGTDPTGLDDSPFQFTELDLPQHLPWEIEEYRTEWVDWRPNPELTEPGVQIDFDTIRSVQRQAQVNHYSLPGGYAITRAGFNYRIDRVACPGIIGPIEACVGIGPVDPWRRLVWGDANETLFTFCGPNGETYKNLSEFLEAYGAHAYRQALPRYMMQE